MISNWYFDSWGLHKQACQIKLTHTYANRSNRAILGAWMARNEHSKVFWKKPRIIWIQHVALVISWQNMSPIFRCADKIAWHCSFSVVNPTLLLICLSSEQSFYSESVTTSTSVATKRFWNLKNFFIQYVVEHSQWKTIPGAGRPTVSLAQDRWIEPAGRSHF